MASRFHFNSYWSTQSNFWSGVLGMILNNILVLVGIWAMVFTGKTDQKDAELAFLSMNFILMASWGIVHLLMGGLTELDQQINDGRLDLTLISPRAPLAVAMHSHFHLPSLGDLVFGLIGIAILGFQNGLPFFVRSLVMVSSSCFALIGLFVLMGSISFWLRRTDAISNLIINVSLSFNVYPVIPIQQLGLNSPKWILFVFPFLLLGVVPTRYLIEPTSAWLLTQLLGSLLFFCIAILVFKTGLRRYQSVSILSQR
jgi:ABC-2 type transport system permease protein